MNLKTLNFVQCLISAIRALVLNSSLTGFSTGLQSWFAAWFPTADNSRIMIATACGQKVRRTRRGRRMIIYENVTFGHGTLAYASRRVSHGRH